MGRDHEAKPKSSGPIVVHPPPASSRKGIERAATEGGNALDPPVCERMREAAGYDLSAVRVHSGPASAAAAEQLGARAFTLGSDIHLGAEAHALNPLERHRLLAHEAAHTIQQGGQRAAPQASMAVSMPGDPAEREADLVSHALFGASPSRSLALRDSLRAQRPMISRMVAPHVQRDIKKTGKLTEGDMKIDMATVSVPGGTSGMSGTIEFTPNAKAPDSKLIKLLQVVRDQESSGADFNWAGSSQANLGKMQTTANAATGVTGGFFVDHLPGGVSSRTKASDPDVSPYYRTYAPNPPTHDGNKKGTSITSASLSDFPSINRNFTWSFETAAKAADTGHVYGTVQWGFSITDAAKGTLRENTPTFIDGSSATFDSAVTEFNKFYKNKGTPGAP